MHDDKFEIIDTVDKQYKDLVGLLERVPTVYVPATIKTVMATYFPCFGMCTLFHNTLKKEGMNIIVPEELRGELEQIVTRYVW